MKNENATRAHRRLTRLLRVAYSSEMAAAYAYQGHAASVSDPFERTSIAAIENDEWLHREAIGRMLPIVGAAPSGAREMIFTIIGKSLRWLCPWSGWTLPMLFAGIIETANVGQYVRMSRYARELGMFEMAAELDAMAEVERRHEAFFFSALKSRFRASASPRRGGRQFLRGMMNSSSRARR